MPIARDIIDRTLATKHGEAAYSATETLLNAGHECFWIGGAPRDMMLGKIPKEIDMATSAKPEDVQKLFPKNDAFAAALGTVVVSVNGETLEITTYREDSPVGDGRKPASVVFGSRENDALRRDATINAMYWNPVTRELFDPCGGEKDIKEKLVRFIGMPEERVTQDALRILRMVRLKATIGGQYEPATYKALQKGAKLTEHLSGTRILEELEKMLASPAPQVALEDLWETGALKFVLPELHACKGVAQPAEFHAEGDVWNHLLECTRSFTEDHGADVRLAALFHDIGKPETFSLKERIRFDHHAEVSAKLAETILKRMQMQGDRTKKITWLVAHHMMMGAFKDFSDERKAHWYFHPWFRELLQIFWLDIAGTKPADYAMYDAIIADYDEFLNKRPRPIKPLLSGDAVMKILQVGPGEAVGKALKELYDAQIRGDVTTKRDAEKFIESLR